MYSVVVGAAAPYRDRPGREKATQATWMAEGASRERGIDPLAAPGGTAGAQQMPRTPTLRPRWVDGYKAAPPSTIRRTGGRRRMI